MTAETKSMTGLSLMFYESALERTEGMASGRLPLFVKYPAVVVVLVTTALDAYINEQIAFMEFLEHDIRKKEKLQKLMQKNVRLRDKWIETPEIVAGRTFDKTAEPYSSFDLLVKLRNMLIHNAAGFHTPSQYPLADIEAYKQRFAFSYVGEANWTSQLLSLECARWACRTSREMVGMFHSLSGIKQLHDWPEPA